MSTLLMFNNVAVTQTSNKASVTPHFICPICIEKPESNVTYTVNIPSNKDLNSNTLHVFTLPCGHQIDLYVAFHKTRGINDLKICIQKSSEEGIGGIMPNWWMTL